MRRDENVATESLHVAAALAAAGFRLSAVEGAPPHRARFVFRREEGIEQAIEDFWSDGLRLPARQVLLALKTCKDRLYEEGRMRQP